jgi:CDP-diacylglycerol--serine O-phosphatidyltransferase
MTGPRKRREKGERLAARLRRRERVVAVLPTLMTLGNAVSGFGAITLAARWTGADPATSLLAAACLIYLAMVFDALDGSAARWAKQTSEFGAQLDSLCDAISFGAAPAFLMLQFSRALGYPAYLLWLIGSLYVVCAVLRLARFNVDGHEDESPGMFSGLPSPAAAGTVASFPVMVYGLKSLGFERGLLGPESAAWLDLGMSWLLPVVTLAVACLMVSRYRYAHLVHMLVRGRRRKPYLIQLVFGVAVVCVMPQVVVPLLCCVYAFGTPLREAWAGYAARRAAGPPAEPANPGGPPA